MRKKTLFLSLLFCVFCFSQQNKIEIDSLTTSLKNEKVDSLKVKLLLKLEYAYRFTDYKKGLQYAQKALFIAKKNNWQRGLAICYNNIGNSYLDRDEYVAAIKNYKKSLNYSEKFLKIRLLTLMNISNIYLREDNFNLAHKYINDAYKIALQLKDNQEIAYCFYQMGLINRDENNIEEAKAYFEKSLKIFNENKDLFQVAEVSSYLAQVETNYKLKIAYLVESKLMWDKVAPDYMSAVTNSILLSETYLKLHENDSLKEKSGITLSDQQLLNEAENYTTTAIKYSISSGNKQNLIDAYNTISRIKFLKNDFENAYKYSVLNQTLKDSVHSQESKNKIAAIENQKEIALRDKEIEINKINLKLKQKQNILMLFGLIVLLIIGGLLFLQNRIRKKNNSKLEKLNLELDVANKSKIKLFGILNHDLRSPVTSFIHYMQFKKESEQLLDEETKNRIENSTLDSAKNLLYSMEEILQWSKSQMDNFKPQLKKIHINDLFEDVKNHFSSFENIDLRFENSENIILLTDENYLKTIIKNLTGNAVKAIDSDKPIIIWKAWLQDDRSYLSITDNGKGADLSQFKALYDENEIVGINSGLGLHLIRDLAKAIDCEIKVESKPNETTIFTLQFNHKKRSNES